MLTAAMHMASTCASPTSSPWQLLLPSHDPDRRRDVLTATAHPPPATATATAATAPHHLRAAGRRVAKRRRPSSSSSARRLPTTYISADRASFRRMVHQVTGADDPPLPSQPTAATAAALPAPAHELILVRAGGGGAAMTLPTLDTSAFLLGNTTGSEASPPALLPCDGSPAFVQAAYTGRSSGSKRGFPTLDSWDLL